MVHRATEPGGNIALYHYTHLLNQSAINKFSYWYNNEFALMSSSLRQHAQDVTGTLSIVTTQRLHNSMRYNIA